VEGRGAASPKGSYFRGRGAGGGFRSFGPFWGVAAASGSRGRFGATADREMVVVGEGPPDDNLKTTLTHSDD